MAAANQGTPTATPTPTPQPKPAVPPTPTPPPTQSAPKVNATPSPAGSKPPTPPVKPMAKPRAEFGIWKWLLILVLVALAIGVISAHYRVGNALGLAKAACDTIKVVASRVDSVEKIAVSAQAGARQANARQDEQIKAENLQLKQMLAYIRLNNPAFGVCSKSEAEVEKLLTNGKWDVEGEIKVEYDRLISLGVATSVEASKSTAVNLNEVAVTANQALDAGQTAAKGLEKIADQPRKILGHSVTKPTAESIGKEIDAYKKKYNVKW